VLQAGHVNTGAFDDFAAVIEWARSGKDAGKGVWIHVDGAFGLWAAASAVAGTLQLVDGVNGADSWATDLHKMLNVPCVMSRAPFGFIVGFVVVVKASPACCCFQGLGEVIDASVVCSAGIC
jgi:hypothetical protein